jgi:hypothetical protein
MMVAGPAFGGRAAWTFAALLLAVLYVVAMAPSWSRSLSVGAIAVALSALVATFASSLTEVALGAGLIIAVCRSGFLYRRRPARAMAIETALTLGGLLFARYLAGPSALATGLAVWGYFLVQSLFFAVSGWQPRAAATKGLDPFDEAERRALAVLRQDITA